MNTGLTIINKIFHMDLKDISKLFGGTVVRDNSYVSKYNNYKKKRKPVITDNDLVIYTHYEAPCGAVYYEIRHCGNSICNGTEFIVEPNERLFTVRAFVIAMRAVIQKNLDNGLTVRYDRKLSLSFRNPPASTLLVIQDARALIKAAKNKYSTVMTPEGQSQEVKHTSLENGDFPDDIIPEGRRRCIEVYNRNRQLYMEDGMDVNTFHYGGLNVTVKEV